MGGIVQSSAKVVEKRRKSAYSERYEALERGWTTIWQQKLHERGIWTRCPKVCHCVQRSPVSCLRETCASWCERFKLYSLYSAMRTRPPLGERRLSRFWSPSYARSKSFIDPAASLGLLWEVTGLSMGEILENIVIVNCAFNFTML